MVRKIFIAGVCLFILLSVAVFFWARSVFTQDTVRTALSAQLSKSLGQPVVIGGVKAAFYPRLTVNLNDVAIGQPARIQIQTLHVGTDLRALFFRRIEHADLTLTGARIDLPLPTFTVTPIGRSGPGGPQASSPVQIVSIDEIVLRDVAITSGGRTVRGDIEIVPQEKGITLRKVTLGADNSTIQMTGRITDISKPEGELIAKAEELNFDRLLAFTSDFVSRSGFTSSARSTPSESTMNLVVSVDANRATMGTLALQKLTGRALVTSQAMKLEPIRFDVFDGHYQGVLTLTLSEARDFQLSAALSGIDMAAVMKFAGSPDTISGRLSGKLNLRGRGTDSAEVLNSARGTAEVAITNGIVKRLGLVRTIVIATSGRSDAPKRAADASSDEPFARLTATLATADGFARTDDLRFESNDLLMTAAGTIRLDGTAIDLAGQVQLSDKLSQQAGRDLVRYTQQDGRVTLPVTIGGSAQNPQVRIDVTAAARQAITNRVSEAIKKGIGRLLGR